MHEQQLQDQLKLEREVIRTMQFRQRKWLTPIGDFFWRRPWRSTELPWRHKSEYWLPPGPITFLRNFIQWARFAHDCSDPSIGCSCHPSFRFPNPEE